MSKPTARTPSGYTTARPRDALPQGCPRARVKGSDHRSPARSATPWPAYNHHMASIRYLPAESRRARAWHLGPWPRASQRHGYANSLAGSERWLQIVSGSELSESDNWRPRCSGLATQRTRSSPSATASWGNGVAVGELDLGSGTADGGAQVQAGDVHFGGTPFPLKAIARLLDGRSTRSQKWRNSCWCSRR